MAARAPRSRDGALTVGCVNGTHRWEPRRAACGCGLMLGMLRETNDNAGVTVIPPNTAALEITRLWLKRLPNLTESERAVAEQVVRMLMTPVMVARMTD